MHLRTLLLCTLIACGGSAPPPTTPTPAKTEPTESEPTATEPATAPTPAPTPAPAPTGAAAFEAIPIPPAQAAGAAGPLIEMAKREIPGATPVGDVLAGQFTVGQLLQRDFTLEPGKCYSVIASSMGNIKELDIQLLAVAPNMPPVVIGKDALSGSGSLIGGRAGACVKNPTPVPGMARLIVRATTGDGVAAALMFVQ